MTSEAQRAGPVDPNCRLPKPPHFLVGRDRNGQWVVRDRNGRCGGVFATRAEALRLAWHERGEGPGAVVLVPGNIELFEASAADACVEQVLPEV